MKVEIVLPWLDIGVKYSVLLFGVYQFFRKCVSEKREPKKTAMAAFFSLAMGVSLIRLKALIIPMHLAVMLVYITFTNCILCRDELVGSDRQSRSLKLSDIAVLSLLSFAICEAIFMMVGFFISVVLSIVYYQIYTAGQSSYMDFLEDTPVHIIAYVVSIFIVWLLIYIAAGMKRLRRGLMNIVERRSGGTGIMLAVLMLTAVMVFGGAGNSGAKSGVVMIMFVPMLLLCVIMIYWAKREIKAEYVRRIRERNLLFLEGSLAEKDSMIEAVALDNERLVSIMRQDDELLRMLNESVREGSDSGTITGVAEEIIKLYSERSGAVKSLESHGRVLCETGDQTLDAVLLYMSGRAEQSGIDFDVEVRTNGQPILGEDFDRREFNTVLADLTENAIISAGGVKDKHVEVMLTRNEDYLALGVLDSGECFDTEVLKKMGRQRVTTHSEEGGSGIGLMTLFKFLHQTGASLVIEEYSGKADGGRADRKFSKSVVITFDGKGKLRIITDRAEELKKAIKSGKIEITNHLNAGI